MEEQRKAVIKNADMSEAMQQDAVDVASAALSKYNIEKARFTLCASKHMRKAVTFCASNYHFCLETGYRGIHQKGIRQKVQSNMVCVKN